MGVNFDNMMVCGLFSSFDPGMWDSEFGVKWLSTGFVVIGMSVLWQVYALSTGMEVVKEEVIGKVGKLVRQSSKFPQDMTMLVCVVFSFVVISNLSGMIPYGFGLSSHLSVNLSLSIPMWMMGVLVYMWKPMDKFLSHFLPSGSPGILWPFLVVVEVVSWLIRPFTLSVRLMANMMAGHLITSLVGQAAMSASWKVSMLPILSGLVSYEIGVCLIQAYVFSSLIILYSSEAE